MFTRSWRVPWVAAVMQEMAHMMVLPIILLAALAVAVGGRKELLMLCPDKFCR
jgi:hypothetical protein